jgi:hypothetical protein
MRKILHEIISRLLLAFMNKTAVKEELSKVLYNAKFLYVFDIKLTHDFSNTEGHADLC